MYCLYVVELSYSTRKSKKMIKTMGFRQIWQAHCCSSFLVQKGPRIYSARRPAAAVVMVVVWII